MCVIHCLRLLFSVISSYQAFAICGARAHLLAPMTVMVPAAAPRHRRTRRSAPHYGGLPAVTKINIIKGSLECNMWGTQEITAVLKINKHCIFALYGSWESLVA